MEIVKIRHWRKDDVAWKHATEKWHDGGHGGFVTVIEGPLLRVPATGKRNDHPEDCVCSACHDQAAIAVCLGHYSTCEDCQEWPTICPSDAERAILQANAK